MILIEACANVDAMTQTGRTPLDIAVKEGEEVIAWLLFSEGAIFEPKDTASGIVLKRSNFKDTIDVPTLLELLGAFADVYTPTNLIADTCHMIAE